MSARVPAREEVHWSNPVFGHIGEQEALFRSIGFGRDQGQDRVPSPQPSVVERPAEHVQVRLAPLVFGSPGDRGFSSRIFFPPIEVPGNTSSSSSSGILVLEILVRQWH